MTVIGLTGGSGAGKGIIGDFLRKRGIPCIDTDLVYHEIAVPGSEVLRELETAFGSSILTGNGELDRAALSAIVFAPDGADKLKTLNRITHAHIRKATLEELARQEEQGITLAAIDAPQLFESGFDRLCDCVIAVTAERETRVSRIMARDGISREKAEKRIRAQLSDDFFRENADYVIENNGTTEEAERILERTLRKIRRRAGRKKAGASVPGC